MSTDTRTLTELHFTFGGGTGVGGDGLYVSPYAVRHPEVYTLRVTGTQGTNGQPTHLIELALVDLDEQPIDEDGCNCDGDLVDGRQVFYPCNNPTCVNERERNPHGF